MAEKFTSASKPQLDGSFKWAWWITFALGYVLCSVISVVIVERWSCCDHFNNPQHKNEVVGMRIWEYLSYIHLPLDKRKEYQNILILLPSNFLNRQSLAGMCLIIHFKIIFTVISGAKRFKFFFFIFRTYFFLRILLGIYVVWQININSNVDWTSKTDKIQKKTKMGFFVMAFYPFAFNMRKRDIPSPYHNLHELCWHFFVVEISPSQ